MSDGAQRDVLTIQGIVIPTEWGANGEPTRVAILTRGEDEYLVAPGGAGERLMGYLQREVLARAQPLGDADHVKRVTITSFAVLEWNESSDAVITTLEVDRV
jgi:hypothetical protein